MIMNTKEFSTRIEKLVLETGLTYMDAVIHYCEAHEMEIEVGAKLCNIQIKQRIEAEASVLNMMKEKINALPV